MAGHAPPNITVARQQAFAPGTILVFDRGYADVEWFAALDTADVCFVTRLKNTVAYQVVTRHPVPGRGHVRADEWIVLTGQQASHTYREGLRRVEAWVPEEEQTLVCVTNPLGFGPTTIARIYTDRWQIELFKALKQNLRVKRVTRKPRDNEPRLRPVRTSAPRLNPEQSAGSFWPHTPGFNSPHDTRDRPCAHSRSVSRSSRSSSSLAPSVPLPSRRGPLPAHFPVRS